MSYSLKIFKIILPRRWRLSCSRQRGPVPSADSNYGFLGSHGNQQENLMNASVGPYNILSTQGGNAYSLIQATRDDHYAQSNNNTVGPYNMLDSSVALWGPPPPYSDPNSPARRTVLSFSGCDPMSRITKRIGSLQLREGIDD